jgi:hypothetical protein
MNQEGQNKGSVQSISWPTLIGVAGGFVISLWLLRYNVLYTEGEVMQGLFTLLVMAVGACVLIGFQHRGLALWCVTLLGGSLLLWQAYQSRKWVIIHEDVLRIVSFAEEINSKTGHYPTNLNAYVFRNPGVKRHIYAVQSDKTNGFRITYFMNDPGITYWYSSKNGFGYYPD